MGINFPKVWDTSDMRWDAQQSLAAKEGDREAHLWSSVPQRVHLWCARISAPAAAANTHLASFFFFNWKHSVRAVHLQDVVLTYPWHFDDEGWTSRASVSRDHETTQAWDTQVWAIRKFQSKVTSLTDSEKKRDEKKKKKAYL